MKTSKNTAENISLTKRKISEAINNELDPEYYRKFEVTVNNKQIILIKGNRYKVTFVSNQERIINAKLVTIRVVGTVHLDFYDNGHYNLLLNHIRNIEPIT